MTHTHTQIPYVTLTEMKKTNRNNSDIEENYLKQTNEWKKKRVFLFGFAFDAAS